MEGRDWLNAAISIPLVQVQESEETVLAARAKALSEISRVICLQDEQAQAIELVEKSLTLWRDLNDPHGLATALLHRGWMAHAVSDYEGAKRIYEQGLHVLKPTNALWLRAQLLCCLGGAVAFQFDIERAKELYQQSKELFEQVDDKTSVADVLKDQGGMLILAGDYADAIACLLKSIGLCYELGHKQFVTTGMGWLSFAIGLRGTPDEKTASLYTARLQGAAQNLMDTIGMTHWARKNPLIQAVLQQLRLRVDEQDWEAAWNAGRALTVEQAIELAYQLGKG
jgi:tetratricopeptide (TPR) repeat protein